MPFAPASATNTVTAAASGQLGFAGSLSRGLRSFFKGPAGFRELHDASLPTRQNRHPGSEGHPWVEISPYGFVSRNYINFVGGRLKARSVSDLPDGSKVINLADGGIILQARSGHVVELDKRRRVIMVRVTRTEAEGARLTLNREELSESFSASTNKRGQAVVVMPGNIVIVDGQDAVSITLPNGTVFYARRNAA